METPDPPSDTPGASKQVVLTPHDIPRSLRVVCDYPLFRFQPTLLAEKPSNPTPHPAETGVLSGDLLLCAESGCTAAQTVLVWKLTPLRCFFRGRMMISSHQET